jgi:hypothetical protein
MNKAIFAILITFLIATLIATAFQLPHFETVKKFLT